MGGLGDSIGKAITFLFICMILGIGGCSFFVIKGCVSSKEYVVKKPVVPEKRLTTDGKKVDTVYVYKF